MIKKACKDEAMSRAPIFKWHICFKEGCTCFVDEHHLEWTSLERNYDSIQKVDQLVHEDCRVTIHEIFEQLDLLYGTVNQR